MQCIGVIDCNNFFVSCERLFRPDLRRVPVVVLSSNDGCIVARSQEVKDKGVPMGAPYFQVKDILKDMGAVCFSSHFSLYRDVSARVFEVVKRQVPVMEVYSVDEAFFTVEVASTEEATEFGTKLKAAVERLVGIPVSVGMSDTKTRAKLVNHTAKRGSGVAVALGSEFLSGYKAVALAEVWGIGRASTRMFTAAGITTVASLLALPDEEIRRMGQLPAARTAAELSGRVVFPVETGQHLPQSIMSTRSFQKKTTSLAVLEDAVMYHAGEVAREAREAGVAGLSLAVLLGTSRHGDFALRGGWRRVTLTVPTNDTLGVVAAALSLARAQFEAGVVYSKAGVVLSSLTPVAAATLSLFAAPDATAVPAGVDTVLDAVTARFGRQALRVGGQGLSAAWQSRQQELSPAYTTDWQQLCRVKAG